MAAVNPYLQFDGNCEAAFNFYRSVFQTEFQTLSRFGDAPANGGICPGPENNIMHVALPIGRGTLLMGSDTPEGGPAFQEGNNFALALNPDNEEEAKRLFAALSEGGTVIMPMEKTFWGALFGLVKDAYGISWMVNYTLAQ
jgi:PhnB protein